MDLDQMAYWAFATMVSVGVVVVILALTACATPGTAMYDIQYSRDGTDMHARADVKNDSDSVSLKFNPATGLLEFTKEGTRGLEAQQAYLGLIQSQGQMMQGILGLILGAPMAHQQGQRGDVRRPTPAEIYDGWKRGEKAL